MNPNETVADRVRSIAAELNLALGRPERVEAECGLLRGQLVLPPSPEDLEELGRLAACLARRTGPVVVPVFSLLEETAPSCADPWPLLQGMLAARDDSLALRAVELAARLAEFGTLPVEPRLVQFLAERAEIEGSALRSVAALEAVGRLLRRGQPPSVHATDPVLVLYLGEGPGSVRRLASRVLDLDGQPAASDLAERLLGPATHASLDAYLRYTRATHLDLLHVAPEPGAPPPALASIRAAEAACGEALLREVIAELGWPCVSLGIEVRPLVGVSLGGSLPFWVLPTEAPLLESCDDARRVAERFLIVAHGGLPPDRRGAGWAEDDPVPRFRAYNLAHAGVLADILDVAPLTREKVERILQCMDRIVADFGALFARYTQECAILPEIYGGLRGRVLGELEQQHDDPQFSAELARLVQMFEDPASLGDVRTLHGLKRYLHQQGLKLGFRLVEAGRSTNRTVAVVLASSRRVLRVIRGIGYVDFEPEERGAATSRVPYPVTALVEGFALQLLNGQESFPDVKVFCYGNEVHYYVAYANHPAFLRVDYAPPLSGGMIDLETYGVSKYVLSDHPNPELDALQAFFRSLDLDVQVRNTHVHARYDKERVLDLGGLCEKAEATFRLLPYLMDLDWLIADLRLSAEARAEVIGAWARRFERWGVVPVGRILTRDRRSILVGALAGPGGEQEEAWTGTGAYRDRWSGAPSPDSLARLGSTLAHLGLDVPPLLGGSPQDVGQVGLELRVLRPLRAAFARGELYATPEGPRRRPPDLFWSEHEAGAFAEILDAGGDELAASARLALLVIPLERSLHFQTTGAVNGYEVQRARLALREGALGLYVLRDGAGMARLALFALGIGLWRRRGGPTLPWERNRCCDAAALAAMLRRDSYLPPDVEPTAAATRGAARALRDEFRRPNPLTPLKPLPGERAVTGLRVSPGRAAGRALFGTQTRRPDDFAGAVLVADAMRPEDSPFLYHVAGIVSTGGGALSHAGLIATQLRKPALIVPGEWRKDGDGPRSLTYRTLEYVEEERSLGDWRIAERTGLREVEHRLREGDLVALDADARTLRVLGQDRGVLALHDGLRRLGDANRLLDRALDEKDLLEARGRRLRAAHQLRKQLARLDDPVVARHAAQEILLGDALGPEASGVRAELLSILLAAPGPAETTREILVHLAAELTRRHRAAREEALRRIPDSASLYEILAIRLEALHLGRTLDDVSRVLESCRVPDAAVAPSCDADLDGPARVRLAALRDEHARAATAAFSQAPGVSDAAAGESRSGAGLRHRIRQIERIDLALDGSGPGGGTLQGVRARLDSQDEAARRRLVGRRVLDHGDCGFECAAATGWKAANLGEVERLAGPERVPPWFVVTHRAFEEVLEIPVGGAGAAEVGEARGPVVLREAIQAVLARADLDDARKSARIRALWEAAPLPPALVEEVEAAYRRLAAEETPGSTRDDALDSDLPGRDEEPGAPFVAVRSSACEEDTEVAARAGEFDTFLFVRRPAGVLEHLKRAWSGLWSERALHNRAVFGLGADGVGGGVIVQRMVNARASGVLQTIHLAEGELREMVINAGLGLGEGVVSGTVAADQVVVARESISERDGDRGDDRTAGRGPLRFRYITADKRERVIFNRRAGSGTARVECLYHQRLRPALEYTELCDLVSDALRLETAYGYPLDLEFALEGRRLWILQVRPVPAFRAVLRETLERYPLRVQKIPDAPVPPEEIRP